MDYLQKLNQLEAIEVLHEEMVISYFINMLSIQSMNVGIKAYFKSLKKLDKTTPEFYKREKWLLDRLYHHRHLRTDIQSKNIYNKINRDELLKVRELMIKELNNEDD